MDFVDDTPVAAIALRRKKSCCHAGTEEGSNGRDLLQIATLPSNYNELCRGQPLCVDDSIPDRERVEGLAVQCQAGFCVCYSGQASGGCSEQPFTAGCDAQCKTG